MQPKKWITITLAPILLVILLLAVYAGSMAPGLTWANGGTDGGDLITAAATGGIAHPTGYPTYLLLARLFQLLPIGSLAWRTHLLSAAATAAAAVTVYDLVRRELADASRKETILAALVSGLAFGLSPLVWSQAVITEVYGLHSLFVAVLLHLSLQSFNQPGAQKWRDRLSGLLLGLGTGNHVTTIFLLPVILFMTNRRNGEDRAGKSRGPGWKPDWHSFLRRLVWMGTGLLVYLILPVRARLHPPVNWGNPVTLDGFFWLVSGEAYRGYFFTFTGELLWDRIQSLAGFFVDHSGILGLLIGLIGMIAFFKPNRLNLSLLWITLASVIFATGYEFIDASMYLIPAFLCFSIWTGIGLHGMMRSLPQKLEAYSWWMGLAMMLAVLVHGGITWRSVDASDDMRAEAFGKEILMQAPEEAILFSKGDPAVFTLWYFHYALDARPDVVVIATDLLHFDWYLETLHASYPDLNLPGPYPFAESVVVANPERPTCQVEYGQVPMIDCRPAEPSELP